MATQNSHDFPFYIAVIGDVVGSRNLQGLPRRKLQQRLNDLMNLFNTKYQEAIAAQFLITTGDEFQGLLQSAHIIPELVWDLEERFEDHEIRLGMGFGQLDTPLLDRAIGMDGSAFHAARQTIELAKSASLFGGVFLGFGETEDAILNGFARLLRHHRKGLTKKQEEVIGLLRQGLTQTEVADELGITRQTVNEHAQAAGWLEYDAGENAWRKTLVLFSNPIHP